MRASCDGIGAMLNLCRRRYRISCQVCTQTPQGSRSGAWPGSFRFRAGASEATRGLYLVLALVIARFPAVGAIELPVLAETDTEVRVAKGTVMIAVTAYLRLIAHNAAKLSVGHGLNASSCRPRNHALVILGHHAWKINRSRSHEPIAAIFVLQSVGNCPGRLHPPKVKSAAPLHPQSRPRPQHLMPR